jgi:transcription initiation factor TFIIIB Brf1 subunit/transcription initiation factor TFIIB
MEYRGRGFVKLTVVGGNSGCGHHRLVKKGHEVVCVECGLVISDFDLSPQQRNYNRPGLWDYTSFTLGSDRLTSKERTELAVATKIDVLASRLALPGYVSAQAMVEARKMLRAVRGKAGVRFTAAETAIAAVWNACKIMKVPVSMREVAKTLRGMSMDYDENRIFRLLNRASRVIDLPRRLMRPRDYIPKITAKLSGKFSYRYLSTVEGYAVAIAESSEEELKGRNPVYSAAAAICAADETLGGRIGRSTIAEAACVGEGIADLAEDLAVKSVGFMLERIRDAEARRVVEAQA